MSAAIGKNSVIELYFNTYGTVKSQTITVCPKLQEIWCLGFEEEGLKFCLDKVAVLKINFLFYL